MLEVLVHRTEYCSSHGGAVISTGAGMIGWRERSFVGRRWLVGWLVVDFIFAAMHVSTQQNASKTTYFSFLSVSI
jgi:hypothetical protein